MSGQRWVLVRDGLVRCYLLSAAEPSSAAKRLAVFGVEAADAPLPDMAPEGAWQRVIGAMLVGDGYTWSGTAYAAPVVAGPRVVDAVAFRALLTGAERIAMRKSDDQLADAELMAIAQNSVNLDSPLTAQLMTLAVAKLAITRARADAVLAGIAP